MFALVLGFRCRTIVNNDYFIWSSFVEYFDSTTYKMIYKTIMCYETESTIAPLSAMETVIIIHFGVCNISCLEGIRHIELWRGLHRKLPTEL